MKHPLYFILLSLFFFISGNAQNNPEAGNPVKKDSVRAAEILNPVVLLSATYQKASGVLIPTEQISSTAITNFTPVDLVDVINQTSGVYIQSGAINTNRITIRGVGSRTLFGTNKIRAYFNGIPITSGSGETTIDFYDTSTLAGIEIVKGPKATQYGSNLGGTILLATKEAKIEGTTVSTNFSAGSNGLFKNTTSSTIKDNNLSIYTSYGHLQLEGFRDNSRYNRNSFLTYAALKISEKIKLGALLQHYDNRAEIASSLSQTDFDEDPTQAAFTWAQSRGFEANNETLAGLTASTAISKKWSNTTSIFYKYLDHFEPRPFNILDEITNGYGARTLFAQNYKAKNRVATLSFGGEWYQDQYRGKTFENLFEENNGNGSLQGVELSNNKQQRTQFNIFATTTLSPIKNLAVEAGVNFNTNQYETVDRFNTGNQNTSANRNFDPIVAPNLSLIYKTAGDLSFFGNVSRGFNYPSVEETLTPDGVINPDIGPEIGWNYEIGSEIGLLKNSIKLKGALYLLSIQDLLVAERVGNDQFIGRNAGKTNHRGLELQVQYAKNLNQNIHINAYVNADFNAHKFIDFVDGDEDFSGNDLTGIPKEKITAGITVLHESGFDATISFRHIGSQPITDANTLFSDDYQLVFTKVGYTKKFLSNMSLNISAGINNVFDTTYASSILINASSFGGNEPRFFNPGAPINFFSGMRLQYHF